MRTSALALLLPVLIVVANRPAAGLDGETPPVQNQTKVTSPDPWEPVRFRLGEWQGTASGEPGTGTVSRRYELVLGNRFIHERNTSTYFPDSRVTPAKSMSTGASSATTARRRSSGCGSSTRRASSPPTP